MDGAARVVAAADELLGKGGRSVAGAARALGVDRSTLHRAYAAVRGAAPGAALRKGAGMEVGYGVVRVCVGWAAVGMSPHGICAVDLGTTATEAEERLRQRLVNAVLVKDAKGLGGVLDAVRRVMDGDQTEEAPVLDLRGTTFQRQVWAQLRRIPPGETRTYAEIAAAMKRPRAVRAVAGACAANPVAVLVPCHRVVGSDGSLAGYRWGVERKETLQSRERKMAVKRG
jgi:AraC family transcriptional regulator, regulatory protein of adaptative response / methylated-DNA-[protein]-cysteine methyltransferase